MASVWDNEARTAASLESYHERLAVAVLRDGIREEGQGYVHSDGGRFWLDVVGVSPEAVESLVPQEHEFDHRSMFAEAK